MGERILIVEDDEVLREVYAIKFGMEGFDVASASDGQEGLDLAVAHRPQLIILDMLMPRVSGLEFLQRFNCTPAAVGVKVLVASNKSGSDMAAAALALGASEYLIKAQLTPEELVVRVREHLAAV